MVKKFHWLIAEERAHLKSLGIEPDERRLREEAMASIVRSLPPNRRKKVYEELESLVAEGV